MVLFTSQVLDFKILQGYVELNNNNIHGSFIDVWSFNNGKIVQTIALTGVENVAITTYIC